MARRRMPFRKNPLFKRFEEAAKRQAGESEAAELIRGVNRYAAGNPERQSLWARAKRRMLDEVTRRMGFLGTMLKGLFGRRGRRGRTPTDKQLEAAINLMDAVGEGARVSPREAKQAEAAMAEALEAAGFTTTPPPGAERPTFEDTDSSGRRSLTSPRADERIPGAIRSQDYGPTMEFMVGGTIRRFKQSDPILTGEMIPVESSNVYAIGYAFNWGEPAVGALKVQFKNNDGTGPGPLYYYYKVHPDLFLRFRLAASKGKFVWDKLRVRGTISGHQYQYELKGITGGYVPRKATRLGPNEYYLKREFKERNLATGKFRDITSQLPDRFVRRYPDRGRPNRGRPSRGR